MYIEDVHTKNWKEVKDFFSLDCEAPHLKLFKHFEMAAYEFNSDVSRFLKIPITTFAFQPNQDLYTALALRGKEGFDAFNYRLYAEDRNLIVLGGIGISKSFLKNRWEARIADKKELIDAALSFLSPFYNMHTDVAITDPASSYYESYEEDICWAFLRQMEGGDKRVTDLRSKVTREKILYPSMNISKDTVDMTEIILKETDPIRKPLEAFRRYDELWDTKCKMPFKIDAERNYENFLKLEPAYVRRLGDKWEYFRPKYQ